MHNSVKLIGITTLLFAVSGCSSDEDEGSTHRELQSHLTIDTSMLYVEEGDVLATGGVLYRLDEGSDDWDLVRSGGDFIVVPAVDHYVLFDRNASLVAESRNKGESWELVRPEFEDELVMYSAVVLIDDYIYARSAEGLHRIDKNFTERQVISGPEETHASPYEPETKALVFNEALQQLWWSEIDQEEDDIRIMRLSLGLENVEEVLSSSDAIFIDGFVDNTDPNTLVIGGEGGVRISHDNGQNWDLFNTDNLAEAIELTAFAVKQDSVTQNYYALLSLDDGNTRTDEMWCSVDQGASWSRTVLGEGSDFVSYSSNSMHFVDKDGERFFFIPTRRGITQGPLSLVDC